MSVPADDAQTACALSGARPVGNRWVALISYFCTAPPIEAGYESQLHVKASFGVPRPGEPFETFWNEAAEDWHYRGAVRLERAVGGAPAGALVLKRVIPRDDGAALASVRVAPACAAHAQSLWGMAGSMAVLSSPASDPGQYC